MGKCVIIEAAVVIYYKFSSCISRRESTSNRDEVTVTAETDSNYETEHRHLNI